MVSPNPWKELTEKAKAKTVPGIRIQGRVGGTERSHEICQLMMFPADQDISLSVVAIHNFLNTLAVFLGAGNVNIQAEGSRQRFDRIERPLLRAICRKQVASARSPG